MLHKHKKSRVLYKGEWQVTHCDHLCYLGCDVLCLRAVTGHFFSPLQTLLQRELTRLRLGCLGKLAVLCRVVVFEVPYQVCCIKCSLFLSTSCNPKFTYLTVCYGNVVVINFIIPPDRRHTRAFRFKLLPCSTLQVLCRILHPARLCTS